MKVSIETIKLMRDTAEKNIQQYCVDNNEDFQQVWNYIINKVDKNNLFLETAEFYRQLYNESLTWK